MKKLKGILSLLSVLFALSPWAAAQEEKAPSPAEQFAALEKEYDEKSKAYSAALRKVSQEARTKGEGRDEFVRKRFAEIRKSMPRGEDYAPRALKIALENPQDEIAFKSLAWIIGRTRSGEALKQALKIIQDKHLENPGVGNLMVAFMLIGSPEAESLLRTLVEKSTDESIKGNACLTLAQLLKRQADTIRLMKGVSDPERRAAVEERYGKEEFAKMKSADPAPLEADAEKFFVRVTEEFSDIKGRYRGTLGETAESNLFELRHLRIGKAAPDIEGEDTDGVAFKLSDYKGKVIVLDFWGHW